MITTFERKGWRDFSQRYAGTYGWYHSDSGNKILVRVTEVDESSVRFEDKNGIAYSALCDKGNVFEFLPLERAVYNLVNDDVVISERVPARQWKRGICRENTSFQSLSKTGGRMDFSFGLLEEVFSQRPNLFYLDSFLEDKRQNVALNSMISFVGINVCVYNRVVGNVNKKAGEILVTNKIYLQEIRDIVRDSFLPYTVMEK